MQLNSNDYTTRLSTYDDSTYDNKGRTSTRMVRYPEKTDTNGETDDATSDTDMQNDRVARAPAKANKHKIIKTADNNTQNTGIEAPGNSAQTTQPLTAITEEGTE